MLEGLDELAAMDPDGTFLLNLVPVAGRGGQGVRDRLHFHPDSWPVALRALDVLVDAFFRAGNDLVVPTTGVATAHGLLVAESVTLPKIPAVSHTAYFHDPAARPEFGHFVSA